MRFSGIARFVAVLLTLLLSPPADSARPIYVCDSLEWVTISARSIGVYVTRPTSVEERPGCPAFFTTPVVLVTPLKGDPPGDFDWKKQAGSPEEKPPPAGTRVLVFHDYSAYRLDRVEILPESPTARIIGYDAEGERIESADAVLSLIDSVLVVQESRRSFLTDHCMGSGAPIDAPEGSDLVADAPGPARLMVPLTPNHRQQLLDLARGRGFRGSMGEDATRWMAARILCRCFKANINDVLLEMLASPWSTRNPESGVIYPARQFAYETLRDLGMAVQVPEGYRRDVPPRDDSDWDFAIRPVAVSGYLPATLEP